ncbi:sulfatase [Aestuariibacter sp. A3R04]|uniref:sulfatase n=1 Tax=Aestuariibacter sp. A3R04 TaxID=2841571 RepID=UPI001C0A50C6|nr:sulfatase [Aestuariibacter sp. A3R04]MBU3020418.1 sulfatase [Aestuariibacter sp. A3R04]
MTNAKWCIFGAIITLLAFSGQASQTNQHNIVMIIVDDLRPVLGTYGDEKAYTPNIDRLASQGVTFNKAYANVPVCGASRASLLTGLRPTKNRFLNYKTLAEIDAPGAKSLPQVLRENGYRTMAIGKVFHHPRDLADVSWSEGVHTSGMPHTTSLRTDAGIKQDEQLAAPDNTSIPWYESADVDDEDYPDGKVKNKTLEALSFLASKDEPFFLSVGFIRPHLPFYAPKKYYDLHPLEKFSPFFHRTRPSQAPASLHGSGEIKTYSFGDYVYNSDEFHVASKRGYYASVSYVDALVGDVLEQLTFLGLREHTTVIFVSDHGFHLGEHNFWTKHTLLKTALQVPLIIAGPSVAKNEKSDALLELIDIFPTVLDLAKIPKPQHIDGQSFTKVMTAPSNTHKKQVYSRFKNGDSIITDDLIFTTYKADDSRVEEMLYDFTVDPYETINQSATPDYKKHVNALKTMLQNCTKYHQCVTH